VPLICASRTGCLHPIEGHAQILPGHVVSKNLSLKSAVLAVDRLQVHRETKSQETGVRKQCDFRQTERVWHCEELIVRMVQPWGRVSPHLLRTPEHPARSQRGMKNMMGAQGLLPDYIRKACYLLISFLRTFSSSCHCMLGTFDFMFSWLCWKVLALPLG
jgi:hypothetical protein